MNKNFFKGLLATVLLMVHLPSMAEDTDLFVGTPPSAADVPNVLIILDNTSNWSTAFTAEMQAVSAVLNGMPADKFRVGFMMFNKTFESGNDGAYVRAAIRLMDNVNKTKYAALINSLDSNRDQGSGGKAGKSMEEAYLYFNHGVPYAGNNKDYSDYMGNVYNPPPAATGAALAASRAVWALPGNALLSKNGSPYTNPILSGCAKNFIIYISNGPAQDSDGTNKQASAALKAAGGSIATIPISPVGSQTSMVDEWARFMKKSPLGITTYTVEVATGGGQAGGWTALMKSAAGVSDGKYFNVTANPSSANISAALNAILSEIQSVNSVFASVSLPVSVNTQGTYLNQVYIGMFRPDQKSSPRWAGNLKQYKLGRTNGVLKLQDAGSAAAINNSTGFITECARSFWTPTTLDSYWAFKPQGACLLVAGSDESNYPDGNIVEKGAQAYKLRSTTTRTVNTCSPTFASCTALTPFTTSNTAITPELLGLDAANATERDALIDWARGQDLNNENLNAFTSTEMRPSSHGDVVHSRPVAINFGTDASPQVVVFYGGNDGAFRAINGNRSASIGTGTDTVTAGSELWSFIPPEFYANLKRIRDNTTTISFPGHTTGSPTPLPKPYGIDGPVAAYKDASKAWVYAAMRRGGRALYAFDVTTPASPLLMWKIGCPDAGDDTGCTTGLAGIGQTWSTPQTLKSSGYGAGSAPMLIMGGGYDTCEDADPNTCTASPKGNKIYLLDADTGALLKAFDTDRSVVADLTVVSDSSGLAQYAYAADLGGNVYRISGANANTPIAATEPANWTITKIAALGCDTPASCTANRKFMFAPEVVYSGGSYFLQIGSGDREKPLSSYTSAAGVANYFFNLKDSPTDASWLTSENGNCSANVICRSSLFGITTSATPTQADLNTKPKGWYLALASSEQVVTSAVTVFGTVTFVTHQPTAPAAGSCTSLGTARQYQIAYTNAASKNGTADRYVQLAGGGLPPSPVAATVQLDDGSVVTAVSCGLDFCEGGDSSVSPIQPKARVYWDIEQ
ncbi:pilus assembly protein [Pseudomonas sp. 2FE]|uniref:pilus assembly protein n=1 Tax=Pseudomonas sp. 2FE TaxID=2502190 RepID=UPI0010F79055|nr:PilC/PilY family type IV pilus protein [Pseudomonas sp. 2FE]